MTSPFGNPGLVPGGQARHLRWTCEMRRRLKIRDVHRQLRPPCARTPIAFTPFNPPDAARISLAIARDHGHVRSNRNKCCRPPETCAPPRRMRRPSDAGRGRQGRAAATGPCSTAPSAPRTGPRARLQGSRGPAAPPPPRKKYTGTPKRRQISSPACRASRTHCSSLMPETGTNGITSAAPMRG